MTLEVTVAVCEETESISYYIYLILACTIGKIMPA